jgi:hypothetical protein
MAVVTFQNTFGRAPCPYEWGVKSETICDLANKLIVSKEWNSLTLHATVQPLIPPKKFLTNNLPLGQARKLIIDVPVDPRGKIDIYIDNMTGLTVDVPGTDNAARMEAAIPLAIEVAAQPNDPNESIPCESMIARDKLTAEGGLSETKMILGWLFNFRTLIVSLLDHIFIAWAAAIQKNGHVKAHHLKRFGNNHQTNGTCGICHSLGPSFSEPPSLPSFPLQKLSLHHNQQNVHEGFRVDDRNFDKSTQGD